MHPSGLASSSFNPRKKRKKTEGESPLCAFWRGDGGVAEDIWEKHIEGRLNLADAKFFHMCCTSARDAIECAGWRVELPFRLRDLSSKETLELAWANGFSKSPARFLGAFCSRFFLFLSSSHFFLSLRRDSSRRIDRTGRVGTQNEKV